jgi:hypothetical protein
MKLLQGPSTEESRKTDRRQDSAERRRRQREIDEERKRRLKMVPSDMRLCGF